jgi:hypothetical protein
MSCRVIGYIGDEVANPVADSGADGLDIHWQMKLKIGQLP